MTDQEIVQAIQDKVRGCRLREVRMVSVGVSLEFEDANEQAVTLTIQGQLKTAMQGGQITVSPSINVGL